MSSKATARLSSKFQISIPKTVRIAHGWDAGQEFAFLLKGEGVLLAPVSKRDDLAGFARGAQAEAYRDRTDRDQWTAKARADLLTCDRHFDGLPGVVFLPKTPA